MLLELKLPLDILFLAAILIKHAVLIAALVIVATTEAGVIGIPADVEYHILPSILVEPLLGNVARIVHHHLLVGRTVIAIPRVPSHRWCWCPCAEGFDAAFLCICGECHQCHQYRSHDAFQCVFLHIRFVFSFF